MKRLRLFSTIILVMVGYFIFSACDSNITLTINFDSNGGSVCEPIEYVVGKNLDMPDDPTKENYIFGGWYTDNGKWADPLTVNTITNYPLSKSIQITAYAKWLSVNYTIKFETNGGETCSDLFVESLSTELPIPKKSGFKFCGWYLDEACENEFSLNLPLNLVDNKITIYTKWERNLKVVFHFNNGDKDAIRYFENEDFTLPKNITREHFTFLNWSFDQDQNIVYDQYLIGKYEKDGVLDLFAIWEEDNMTKIEIYDRGNMKEFYHWGEEIDVSQTKLKITYADGTSRIAYAFESKQIRDTKYYARGFLTSICSSTEEPYFYFQMGFYLYYRARTENYVIAYVNIYSDIKSISVENYNNEFEFEPLKDSEFSIDRRYKNIEEMFNENTKLNIEDNSGFKTQVNLKDFYNQNKEDFSTDNIGVYVTLSRYFNSTFGTYCNKLVSGERVYFENNKAYLKRQLNFQYKTKSIQLDYKLLLDEIDCVEFITEDFYPGEWNVVYKPYMGGILGDPNYTHSKIDYCYKDRTENASVLKKENYDCVRLNIKLKNGLCVLSNLENLLNANQYEIVQDICIEENIARATIKINDIEYNITSDELLETLKR